MPIYDIFVEVEPWRTSYRVRAENAAQAEAYLEEKLYDELIEITMSSELDKDQQTEPELDCTEECQSTM